jgi:fibronectin-binding autotransporter adhesin
MYLISSTRSAAYRSRHRWCGRLAIGTVMAIGILLTGRGSAWAANACLWIGASGGTFATATNWSSCGGLAPQPADAVLFDVSVLGGSNNACTISAAVNVASIAVQNGYTKIVSTSGSPSLLVGSMTVTTGTFTAGTSPLQITGGLTINGGTFNAPSGALQIGGAFVRTSGSLAGNGGTVIFNATGAVTHTFSGGAVFNKVIINDGLVGYWNLDEGSGTSLADQSGYANGLTLSASSFTASIPTALTFSDPSAVAFNGAAWAHLATAPTNLPSANGAETISAWVKFGSTATVQDVVALGDGGTNGVKLGILSSGTLAAWTWGASPTTLASTTAANDGAWHQVTFTYDGLSTNKLYLDGALKSTTAAAHQVAATTVADLGSYDGTHELMAAGGAIDDVRIYNRALTLIEVSALALGNMPSTGVATHTFSGVLTTNGDLVIASGILTGVGSATVSGNWLNDGGAFTATGGVTLKAASGVILSGGQPAQGNLTISSGATYTLSDRLWFTNRTVTVTGGLNTGSYLAHIGTLSGTGSLNPGTGTVVLDNSITTTACGSSFNNLRIEDSKNEANQISYWKFDEGNGSTTYDLQTTSANNGTLHGGATWTTGASGVGYDDAAGLAFDGTGYVSTGVTSIPKPDAKMTISVWVKLNSIATTQDFVASNDGAGNGIKLGIQSAGTLAAWTWGATPTTLVSMTAPSDGAWHQVTYSYDGTNNNLYLDGVAATSTTAAHQTGTITQGVLGSADGASEFLSGSLDDVRIFKVALTATQIAQLAVGRYAGAGGYSTVKLGVNTTISGALSLDAGSVTDTSAGGSFTLTAALASTITAGTYTVAGAAQTFSGTLTVQPTGALSVSGGSLSSGDLTVQSPGTVTLSGGTVSPANMTVQSGATLTLGGTGSVAIGSGKALTMDGTLKATSTSASVTSASGKFAFRIGSVSTATPTLSISGLTVQNTDANGMWIGVNSGAIVTLTEFDNIAFSNGTGSQLLQITAGTIYLGSSGCTFDGSTTYAVKAVGTGTNTTRAVFGAATCATNSNGICATSEKSDDDTNNDGVPDSPGNGANFGAVVQFTRAAAFSLGTFQGIPTAAFDWNTFSYYSTYSVFRNDVGSADVIYVRDESGNALYSWSTASNQNIVGTPQWTSTTVAGVTTHYLYVTATDSSGTNVDKIYRLVDTGTGTTSGTLSLDPAWTALGANPYNCGCAIKSPASIDVNNVYWAASTGTAAGGNLTQVLMELGQSTQSVLTGWPLTTPKNVTASPPTLETSGATTLYLGVAGDLLQLDVSTTTFVTNTKPGTINGRVSYGTSFASGTAGTIRVYAGNSGGTMWAWNPANITGTNFLWSYAVGGSNAITGSYYDGTTDTIQFGTNGGKVVALTGAGSGTNGVVLNAGYPYTLDASDPISAAPLYYKGVLVVGSTKGKLYFLDRNTGTAPGVSIIREYSFGPTESVSGVGYDVNVNRYLVAVSSSAKDGRLYYFDSLADPTPTFQ